VAAAIRTGSTVVSVPALAVQHDLERVGPGHRGPAVHAEHARGQGHDVLAEHDVRHREPRVQAVIDHRLRALADLLRGLEDEQQRPVPGAFAGLRGQVRRGAEQAGDVHVVAAGVHHRDVRVFRPVGARVRQAGLLKHRQPVHVGAQQHRRPGPVRQHADHAGAAHPGRDLVAEFAQAFRDDPGRPVLGEREFRVGVQVAVERGQFAEVRAISHWAASLEIEDIVRARAASGLGAGQAPRPPGG
jgi:hypothetical protein